jgi:MFS family permease
MPAIETQFDAGRAEASLPYVLTMIGFALGNMWLGQLVDRLGVTKALIGAAVLSTVSYVLATLAPNMVMLSLAHLLVGLGTSIGFGPLIADISHWFMKRRGIAVALVASGNYLSGAIWPTLLSDILARDGWQQVYLTLALITPVIVIPLSLLLRRQVPAEAHQTAAASASIKASSVGISPRALQYILGLAGIGCCVAMSMPQVHIVSYCVGLGYGPAVGAEMLSLMLLGGVVSRVVSGMVADKLGGLMTLLIGSVLQCIALFLFLPYDGMVSLYIISLMFGLAQGGIVPSYALGMALGGWMSGWIYDVTGNYQLAFINGILWNGLNIAILLMLLKRSRPRRQEVMA